MNKARLMPGFVIWGVRPPTFPFSAKAAVQLAAGLGRQCADHPPFAKKTC
jgi:hypothetical protein